MDKLTFAATRKALVVVRSFFARAFHEFQQLLQIPVYGFSRVLKAIYSNRTAIGNNAHTRYTI